LSQCHAAPLPDRAAIRVAGTDARNFLQGLITNDIGRASDGTAIHAGLLSPQGKILFDFFVVPLGNAYLLECAKVESSELAKRLGFYRLRAGVEIAEEPGLSVAAVWGGTPSLPEGAIAYADPRVPDLGYRVLLPDGGDVSALACADASQGDYHAMRIGLGVPEGGRDYAFGDSFPHEALFDQLNGVDFAKGCFVGQEVVSRMEHRGTARKRVVPVEGDAGLPEPGTSIEADGQPVGTLGSVSGASGLALIRLDRATEAIEAGVQLKAGGVAVKLRKADWARFAVPSEGHT
jgi:folate-binding protein YgfZ